LVIRAALVITVEAERCPDLSLWDTLLFISGRCGHAGDTTGPLREPEQLRRAHPIPRPRIRLAELRRFSNLGPLSLVVREEPDVRSALRILRRYEHLYNEALHIHLAEADAAATIRIGSTCRRPGAANPLNWPSVCCTG
jgi:hypothetical protein